MNDTNRYLNIELLYNNTIINTYTLPESNFILNNESDITILMNDIFVAMINDLDFKTGSIHNGNEWDSVNFYILSDDIKINEINKTKYDIDSYNSYGEAIVTIYNQIKNNN